MEYQMLLTPHQAYRSLAEETLPTKDAVIYLVSDIASNDQALGSFVDLTPRLKLDPNL